MNGLNFVGDYCPGGRFITFTAIPEHGSWLILASLVGTGCPCPNAAGDDIFRS